MNDVFNSLDEDGDGRIRTDQVVEGLTVAGIRIGEDLEDGEVARERVEALIRHINTDADGYVDADGFLLLTTVSVPPASPGEIREALRVPYPHKVRPLSNACRRCSS